MKIKTSHIFEKGHSNKGWEKIEKWITDDDICASDLMALVCTKFGQLPQVRSNEILSDTTTIMVAGEIYEITIKKCNKGLHNE